LKNYCHYKIWSTNKKFTEIKKKNNVGSFILVKAFEQPVTRNKLAKIYIVKFSNEIIYVGIASQSMRARLWNGFQASGKNGYHGYRWKGISSFELLIWCFPGKDLKDVEGVEAELVYLIRHDTGAWPKYQSEIHFHQATEHSKKIAAGIYKEISG